MKSIASECGDNFSRIISILKKKKKKKNYIILYYIYFYFSTKIKKVHLLL